MLLLFCFLTGCVRGYLEKQCCERELALCLDGKKVTVIGKAIEIEEKEDWIVVILESPKIGIERTKPESGMTLRRIQVYLDKKRWKEPVELGNQLQVSGVCSAFGVPRNPGEFHYQLYYRSQKLTYRMFGEKAEITEKTVHWYKKLLYDFREKTGQLLDEAAGEDGGMFRALILGDKRKLPEETRLQYQKNGIAHLLAVSGLHLSLISMGIYGLCRRFGAGYGMSGLVGGGVLISYGILTGASPSVIRALIMSLCGYGAAFLGRTPDLFTSLSLAAFWIFWDSPYYLCQAGVQLSFCALIGIGASAEEGDSFFVTISMQLVSLPVILFHFFQVPLYGMFLNLVTVPLMGIVAVSGAGAAVFAGLFPEKIGIFVSRYVAGGGRLVLDWYDWCCHFMEKLPGNNLILGRPDFWEIGFYYGILIPVFLMRNREKKGNVGKTWKKWLLLLPALLVLLPEKPNGLIVTFLDVGQGDGICLETKEHVVLIDCGSSDQKKLGEYRLEPFLKSRGISAVDYGIITHGDQDHISGILWLLEQKGGIFIKNLVLPAAGFGDEIYREIEEKAENAGSRVLWLKKGDQLKLKKLNFTCLYPEGLSGTEKPDKDRNEHSLALWMNYGDLDVVFTGDMSQKGEARILEQESLPERRAEVLKAGHHGSETSSSEAWLKALSPSWAVISCGEGNRYGHPHKDVLERMVRRGVSIYDTRTTGAVFLHTDGRNIQWREWLK